MPQLTERDVQILVNSASRDAAIIVAGMASPDILPESMEIMYSNLLTAISSHLFEETAIRQSANGALDRVQSAFPGATVVPPASEPAAVPQQVSPAQAAASVPAPAVTSPAPPTADSDDVLWTQLFAEIQAVGGVFNQNLPSFYANFTAKDGTPSANPRWVHKDSRVTLWVTSKFDRTPFIVDALHGMGL